MVVESGNDHNNEELYRLVKENNRMLHSMRRRAFWAGLFKLLIWVGLIVAPIWLYATYLAPLVQSVQQTVNQVQGTGTKVQGQLNGLGSILEQFQARLPAMFQANQ